MKVIIKESEIKYAPTSKLVYLNDVLSGKNEYANLKENIRAELKERKKKRQS